MKRRTFLKMSVVVGLMPRIEAQGLGAANAGRPNILWIMMDDSRPDALGCYGAPWANTPNMDRLADEGVRFETAVVQCPICIPSRTSMKTSHYCHEFGLMSMGDPPAVTPPYGQPRPERFDNLLTAWTDAGMQPVNVGKRHAFVKDWSSKGDPRPRKAKRTDEKGKKYPEVNLTTHNWRIGGTIDTHPDDTRPAMIVERTLEVLGDLAEKDRPFFLRVSFHAPHVPIRVPPSFMIDPESINLPFPSRKELESKPRFEREQLQIYAGTLDLSKESIGIARGTYYGMVSLVDHYVGDILDALDSKGLAEKTVVALNTDHGLQLGEHGLHKKRNFYDETIRSPLLMRFPGRLPAGKVVSEQVEMVDFVPTLMDLSGLDVPEGIVGKSLAPLMRGETDAGREAVFSEIDQSGSMYDELRHDSGRRVMVRTRKWKLIYFKDPRVTDKDGALYDLESDPAERFNLYNMPEHKDTIAGFEALVDKWDKVQVG